MSLISEIVFRQYETFRGDKFTLDKPVLAEVSYRAELARDEHRFVSGYATCGEDLLPAEHLDPYGDVFVDDQWVIDSN